MKPAYTTEAEIRRAFFSECRVRPRFVGTPGGGYRGAEQNEYPATERTMFCDFVEGLVRSGHISEALARRVTLGPVSRSIRAPSAK